MSSVLDDLDARPGSATSLLRTLIGSSMRLHGGWLASATVVQLMREIGMHSTQTRTALNRVKSKGLLAAQVRHGLPGYRLTPAGERMLARGDRRIYQPRLMDHGDPWCVISFSVPVESRDRRHQLRRRLAWIGCGTVTGALWICPAFLVDEVEEIVAEVGLTAHVTVFLVEEIRPGLDLAEAVAAWWDLEALGAMHEAFLAQHAEAARSFYADPEPVAAFRTWIPALDSWRPIPYLDPGLPAALLPADWPGHRSIPLFLRLRDAVAAPSRAFVGDVIAQTSGS